LPPPPFPLPPPPPPPQDYAFLAAVTAATTFLLRDAYGSIASYRLVQASDRLKDSTNASADPGTEALWGAVFQTNYWSVLLFGFIAYVIGPQVIDWTWKYAAWTHTGTSILIPAIVAFAAGRGYF
jgi:hypothetical protein